MKIIILGPQGSGKGTQTGLISKKFNIPKISMGDILRYNVSNKTELGELAGSYMNKGNLVPDDVVNKIVKDRISKDDCKNGFILDGYPRNVKQAEMLKKITDIDFVLEVDISDKEAIKRISGRRSCSCGEVYHTFYNPPKISEICDKCGSRLFQREDDKEEYIKKRLETYHKETSQIIEFYKEKHIRIEGKQTIEKVFEDIIKTLL